MGSGEENYISSLHDLHQNTSTTHFEPKIHLFHDKMYVNKDMKPVILSFTTLTGFLVRHSSQRQNAQGG